MDRSKKGNGQYNLATQPKLPVRYRCKVGKEWKPLDSFSKSQQKRFIHPDVSAAHSGMTCIEHGSVAVAEYRCEGKCGLLKRLDEFSKNRRRQGEYVCKRCVAWDETQEWEVTPGPLETGHISAEEIVEYHESPGQPHGTDLSIFGSNMTPLAPVTGLRTLSLGGVGGGSHDGTDASSIAGTNAGGMDLPPHLAGLFPREETSTSSSRAMSNTQLSAANSVAGSELPDGHVPPHMRGPGSLSTATTAREAKHDNSSSRQVAFNAWDPRGVQHSAVKTPTLPSSSATDQSAPSDGGGEWQQVSRPESKRRNRGNWPSSRESRLQPSERKAGGRFYVGSLRGSGEGGEAFLATGAEE